jgi:putative PIN family toxin of toxin-antitoxin system
MPRVVFDTNILISAFITPGGRGDEAVRGVIQDRATLITSIPLMTELARKLHGKFDWDRERALRAARFVASIAVVVSPRRRLAILRDEPDNRVLECAVEGGANLVVTGDRHLLGLGTFESIQIVTLAYYLKYLDNHTVP